MSMAGMRANADQFRQIRELGVTHELVSGEIVEREMATAAHDAVIARLQPLLTRYFDEAGRAVVFRYPWPLELSKLDVVRPDLYVMALNPGALGTDGVRGTPELVVEVVSPESGERDRGEKLRLYAWAGVREYWLIDPVNKTLEGKTKGRQGYDDLPADPDRFTSVRFPDLTIVFSTLFD